MSTTDDKTLAGGWTQAKLAARNPEERFGIWKNARSKATPETLELASIIESLGMISPIGGLKMDDPLTLQMFDIINSPNGRAACSGWRAIRNIECQCIR